MVALGKEIERLERQAAWTATGSAPAAPLVSALYAMEKQRTAAPPTSTISFLEHDRSAPQPPCRTLADRHRLRGRLPVRTSTNTPGPGAGGKYVLRSLAP